MSYQVISFNHKNCQLALREKLTFSSDEEKRAMLEKLLGFDFIEEAFILSTCNRVEITLVTRDKFSSYHAILGLLSLKSKLSFFELKGMAGRFDDIEAVRHIFSVASALDSLVIGETQITGQLKDAYRFAFQNEFAYRKLNRLISYAIKCAKEVRNVTTISKHPLSIASVAVAKAYDIYGDNITGMSGVVIGTGEMGKIAIKNLIRLGCDVVILGRNLKKIERFVEDELNGDRVRVDSLDNIHKYINRYRLLFSATSSKEPIITEKMIESDNIDRVWFDMAIPKDIEDIKLDRLKLFRIDDLKSIANENFALKQEQANRAFDIVDNYTKEFYRWLRALSIEPLIKGMRLQVKEAIEIELNRAIKKGFVPKEYRDNIEKMAHQAFNRFLHRPTKNLRELSKDNSSIVERVKDIFDIEIEDRNMQKYKKEHNKGHK
jgi:glutamyl-tRNA reductase